MKGLPSFGLHFKSHTENFSSYECRTVLHGAKRKRNFLVLRKSYKNFNGAETLKNPKLFLPLWSLPPPK